MRRQDRVFSVLFQSSTKEDFLFSFPLSQDRELVPSCKCKSRILQSRRQRFTKKNNGVLTSVLENLVYLEQSS